MIRKRDGKLEEFNPQKIKNAIKKAFEACEYPLDDPEQTFSNITADVIVNEGDSVEDIQDQVIEVLRDYDFDEVADAYALYRRDRALVRAEMSKLISEIKKKLEATNVANQNANVDERSFGGRMGEANRVVTKDYALNYCMSEMARNNHLNNEIYIHDLDSYAVGMHNCLTLPIDDLLAKGFNTRQTDVRPANSINTAFQLVAVTIQLQSLQQFGGVSCSHLDWTMVPYVRKSFYKHWREGNHYITGDYVIDDYNIDTPINDYAKGPVYDYAMDMTSKELRQAVEGMYHNLNTLQSRSGNQLPFSSINYGTCTLPEGRMVTEALLMGSINGVGKYHKTPIFPCGIFQYMKGVNDKYGTPNYDLYQLALKSTSQRLYPNYANVDWSGNAGYDPADPRTYFSTMGCRTANGWDVNGFGQLKDGRGNICPVTIILPTLAMEMKKELQEKYTTDDHLTPKERLIHEFMVYLDTKIYEAKEMLLERFEWICSQSPDSAKFMYENHTMAGYIPEEGIRSALKHGTLALGQLGLAETLQILIGKNQTTPEGMDLAKRIESLFKKRCAEFKEKYKLNFGVYYTPAENLCHTALKKFRKKYGVITNVSDKEFFTNSIHVPVWEELTPMEKIDVESQLTGYSSAGCITYVELPSTVNHNLQALEEIVTYAMHKDIPYFAINIPVDNCNDCGASGEFGETCPECGSTDILRLRRVTGYLSGDYRIAFNKGKQDETEHRVKHSH